jgi:hypothetical protein
LVSGGSCSVTVSFTPSAAGPASGTLSVAGSDGTATVSLSGTGTVPQAALSSGSVDFGARQTDQGPSDQQLFTLSNPGNEALSVSAISASGDTGDFFVGPTTAGCAAPFSLPVGGSCTYAAVFRPTAIGTRGATLTFAHNAAGGSSSIGLTGTGAAPPNPPAGPPPSTSVDGGPGGGSTATGAPLISIRSPKAKGTVTRSFKARRKGKLVTLNRPVTFKGLASDRDGLSRVEIALVKGTKVTGSPRFRRAKLDDFAWSYALPTKEKLAPGTYTLLARATDVKGVRSANVAVTFRIK